MDMNLPGEKRVQRNIQQRTGYIDKYLPIDQIQLGPLSNQIRREEKRIRFSNIFSPNKNKMGI